MNSVCDKAVSSGERQAGNSAGHSATGAPRRTNIPRLRRQRLLVFLTQMAALYPLLNNVPGEKLISTTLTMQEESRVDTCLSTGRLEIGTFCEQCQGLADTSVTAGKKALDLGVAQRFEIQLNVRNRAQTFLQDSILLFKQASLLHRRPLQWRPGFRHKGIY